MLSKSGRDALNFENGRAEFSIRSDERFEKHLRQLYNHTRRKTHDIQFVHPSMMYNSIKR